MPPGFHLLIIAQFLSALADNALLIVAIALLEERGLPGWWAPLLKFSFTISYVLLAPFVGPLADAFPKARLMAWMNAIKVMGVLAMLLGIHPVLAFGVVGLGAAAYAPAKYGLATEMVGPDRLVAANGWIEVSVICAVLLGTILGGLLVSDWVRGGDAAIVVMALAPPPGAAIVTTLSLSLLVVLSVYGLAALLNTGIPDSGARYPSGSLDFRALVLDFHRANRTLWRDREGGLSLAVTTAFWGVGATLQFAVLRWAVESLGLQLNQAAQLQAIVAIGIVAGAALAGRYVRLDAARHLLPAGVLLGLLIPTVAIIDRAMLAAPTLLLVGAVGGLLVVPMNALLQHRGFRLLSAGRSIAVQGFNENLSVLCMLAGYSLLLALDVPVVTAMCVFGVLIAAAIAFMIWRERLRSEREMLLAMAPREAAPGSPGRVVVGALTSLDLGAKNGRATKQRAVAHRRQKH